MAFFKTLIGKEPFVGLDIGTTSIKIAEVEKNGDQFHLKNYGILETYGYLERFNEALQSSSLKLSEKNTSAYLKLLLKKANVRAKAAIVSIPSFLAFSTLIEAPPMSHGEIKKFLEYQAKQYIPLPMNTVTFDWMKVGEREDESGAKKSQILLISIPNEQIERYQNVCKKAGLRMAELEIESMSLARSLTINEKELQFIVDIGSRSTNFAVAKEGMLKFSGQTDFSGSSLTQAVSRGLNIGQRRAEDLKKQRGLVGFGQGHELSTLIQPMLDVIINEAKRVMNNYETNYHEEIKGVILSGGGSNLKGIEEYAGKQFALPVKKAYPFTQVQYDQSLEPIAKETGPLLAVAIGAGAKGLIK